MAKSGAEVKGLVASLLSGFVMASSLSVGASAMNYRDDRPLVSQCMCGQKSVELAIHQTEERMQDINERALPELEAQLKTCDEALEEMKKFTCTWIEKDKELAQLGRERLLIEIAKLKEVEMPRLEFRHVILLKVNPADLLASMNVVEKVKIGLQRGAFGESERNGALLFGLVGQCTCGYGDPRPVKQEIEKKIQEIEEIDIPNFEAMLRVYDVALEVMKSLNYTEIEKDRKRIQLEREYVESEIVRLKEVEIPCLRVECMITGLINPSALPVLMDAAEGIETELQKELDEMMRKNIEGQGGGEGGCGGGCASSSSSSSSEWC